MTGSVMGRLIATELYLYRWLILATIAAGLAAIAVSALGETGSMIGGILLVTSLITLGVFLALYPVFADRHHRTSLFVLSLPISPRQVLIAKIASSFAAFLLAWTVLTGTIVGLALASGGGARLAVVVPMMGLLLANFAVLLAVGIITGSELWAVAGIILTNTSVPVFMSTVLPDIAGDAQASAQGSAVALVLGLEAVTIAIAVAAAFYRQSRKTDFV